MNETITFDTGALIALERRRQRISIILRDLRLSKGSAIVPQVVLTEWWRGRTDARDAVLGAVVIEPLTDVLAKLAGEAIAEVEGATAIDAIVMASAALRGDTVYTSDFDDLDRLRDYFPNVRVLSV